jgi:hypothetical protein
LLQTGQATTIVLVVTNGSPAYYPTAFTVDGVSITPKYPGGAPFTAGSVNAIDVYSMTIIKTASATFTALLSQVKYA